MQSFQRNRKCPRSISARYLRHILAECCRAGVPQQKTKAEAEYDAAVLVDLSDGGKRMKPPALVDFANISDDARLFAHEELPLVVPALPKLLSPFAWIAGTEQGCNCALCNSHISMPQRAVVPRSPYEISADIRTKLASSGVNTKITKLKAKAVCCVSCATMLDAVCNNASELGSGMRRVFYAFFSHVSCVCSGEMEYEG
jgi:hypothetical protein